MLYNWGGFSSRTWRRSTGRIRALSEIRPQGFLLCGATEN
jgi:hypothetical protein